MWRVPDHGLSCPHASLGDGHDRTSLNKAKGHHFGKDGKVGWTGPPATAWRMQTLKALLSTLLLNQDKTLVSFPKDCRLPRLLLAPGSLAVLRGSRSEVFRPSSRPDPTSNLAGVGVDWHSCPLAI